MLGYCIVPVSEALYFQYDSDQWLFSYFNLDPPPSSGNCFPSVATVETENGRSVAMSELQIGSKVKTGFIIKIFIYFSNKGMVAQTLLNLIDKNITSISKYMYTWVHKIIVNVLLKLALEFFNSFVKWKCDIQWGEDISAQGPKQDYEVQDN